MIHHRHHHVEEVLAVNQQKIGLIIKNCIKSIGIDDRKKVIKDLFDSLNMAYKIQTLKKYPIQLPILYESRISDGYKGARLSYYKLPSVSGIQRYGFCLVTQKMLCNFNRCLTKIVSLGDYSTENDLKIYCTIPTGASRISIPVSYKKSRISEGFKGVRKS